GVPQHAQRYMPSAWLSQYLPVNARSVPFLRAISYCSRVSFARHSASVFVILSVIGGLLRVREGEAESRAKAATLHRMQYSRASGCPASPPPFEHRLRPLVPPRREGDRPGRSRP